MADLAYKVTVDTNQAQKSLDGLNKTIGGLKSALAGLAIGNFIANIYRGAEAIQDLSDATGFASQTIIGLGRAFQENGSSVQVAQEAIARFTKNVGEAAAGNAGLQQSFREIGISLQDLATLSEEQLFLKTIQGLANVTDKATQARLAAELLGKSARANFGGIAGSMNGYIAASAEAAKANDSADKAAQNFERAITNLQDQLKIVLDPISTLAANINVAGESIGRFLEIVKNVAIVAGAFFLVTKAVRVVVAAFEGLMAIIGGFGRGLALIRKTWDIFLWQLGKIKQAGGLASESFDGFSKRLKFLKLGIDLVAKGLGLLASAFTAVASFFFPEEVTNAFKRLGEMLGFVNSETDKLTDKKKKLNETLADNDAMLAQLQAERQVINALQEKIKTIQQVGEAYKQQNRDILTNIENELKYIKMTDREAETQKALDDLYKRTADTIQGLFAQKAKLNEKQIEEKKAIDETIASINNQARADAERISTAIANLQKEREAIDARNRALEFGETIRQDTASLEAMQAEIDMLYMNTEEREKYKQKLENERGLKERLAQIDREAAQIGKDATQSQIDDFNRRREAAIRYYNELAVLQENERVAREDQGRQIQIWSEDTKKSLEDSISPANRVKDFWNGLSGQIDNFTKTGKFKIKDFLASIIQDFIAAQLKLAALNFLKSIGLGGGGGLLGGSIIPGFLAGGGNAQQGKPYIVGEKGPELFVPPTAGRVVPNYAMEAGSVSAPVTNNYITNNISAVDAQSVAQLFAANRKTLLGTVRLAEKELPYAG